MLGMCEDAQADAGEPGKRSVLEHCQGAQELRHIPCAGDTTGSAGSTSSPATFPKGWISAGLSRWDPFQVIFGDGMYLLGYVCTRGSEQRWGARRWIVQGGESSPCIPLAAP